MIKAVENLSTEDKALQNNLEGNINDEEEEKQAPTSPRSPTALQEKLSSEEYLTQVLTKTMRQQQISQEGQIYIAENVAKFKEYFIQFFKQFGNKKMTMEDIDSFKQGLEQLREQ